MKGFFNKSFFSGALSCMIGAGMGIWLFTPACPEQKECKPCPQMSLNQMHSIIARYDKYVDDVSYGPKGQRAAAMDSVRAFQKRYNIRQ